MGQPIPAGWRCRSGEQARRWKSARQYSRKKDKSYVEQLEYELAKAEVEIAKLKKDAGLERRCRLPKK